MKRFLIRIFLLFCLVVAVLSTSLFFVPDVLSSKSLLGAVLDKHELLERTKSPRIIFAGGSNLSFGLDSRVISDSLKMPVVNTAVHGGLGLKYTMDDCLPFIQKGDILVLAPEYENYYTENFYGEVELVSVLFDIDPNGKTHINGEQWKHLLPYLPTYSAKKLKNFVLSPFRKPVTTIETTIYDRGSFNANGDAYLHWTLPNQNYLHCKKASGKEKTDPAVISYLIDFQKQVTEKGATFILFPPVIDESSFGNQSLIIQEITDKLAENNLTYATLPKRYSFPDSLFFNSYYHLNKQGVDLRTKFVIKDLKAALSR